MSKVNCEMLDSWYLSIESCLKDLSGFMSVCERWIYPSIIWVLIWGHDMDKLGIKVCVGKSLSNKYKKCFNVCYKILQFSYMLDNVK